MAGESQTGSTTLDIKLKASFREPVQSGIGFTGREDEQSRLSAIISNRQAATVLVSGDRGVGKSSLVKESASRAKSKDGRIVVELTLPHADEARKGGSSQLRGYVLRSLIRSLYLEIEDDDNLSQDILEDAQDLYDKTYFKEVEQYTAVKALAEAEAKHTQRQEHHRKYDLGKTASRVALLLGAGAVGLGGIHILTQAVSTFGLPGGIGVLLMLAGFIGAAGYSFRFIESEEKNSVNRLLSGESEGETSKLDLSAETLEAELETLLEDLAKESESPVFIIDELDKLRTDGNEDQPAQGEPESGEEKEEFSQTSAGDSVEEHIIFQIVSSLKNFFTLGHGIFIFISGYEFYENLRTQMNSKRHQYTLAHTLFTDRLFIHRMHYSALENLVDSVLAESPSDREAYRKFRNYLCWISKSHVFDLLNNLEEFVEYENGQPVLRAWESDVYNDQWKEGNLPDRWKLAAGLQKYIGAIYDEAQRPPGIDELFNQALWVALFKAAGRLYDGETVSTYDEEFKVSNAGWLAETVEPLSEEDREDIGGAVDRLLKEMERFGASVVSDSYTQGDVKVEEYSLSKNPSYPGSNLGTAYARTGFEGSFLEIVDEVEATVENLEEAGGATDQFQERIDDLDELAQQVEMKEPKSAPPRSRVKSAIQAADELLKDMIEYSIDHEIRRWAEGKGYQVSQDLNAQWGKTGRPWKESLNEFPSLAERLPKFGDGFYMIGGDSSENQVLVILNLEGQSPEQIVEAYTKKLSDTKGRERRKQRLPVLVLYHDPEDVPDFPTEVIETIREERGGFLRSFFREAINEREEVDVAGWYRFELDTRLKNVESIQNRLEEISYISPGADNES